MASVFCHGNKLPEISYDLKKIKIKKKFVYLHVQVGRTSWDTGRTNKGRPRKGQTGYVWSETGRVKGVKESSYLLRLRCGLGDATRIWDVCGTNSPGLTTAAPCTIMILSFTKKKCEGIV